MLQRVLERCRAAAGPAAVALCTDSEELAAMARVWGVSVLLTSASCLSGSERLASVADRLAALAWEETAEDSDPPTREQQRRQTAVI